MKSGIHLAFAVLLALLVPLVGCPAASSPPPRPPESTETPPSTNDPGAVQDRPDIQPSPPPEQGTGSGGSAAGSATPAAAKPDGSPCLASIDCDSGVCEGEGCGPSQPGKCAARSRACTRDLRQYCGCDGKTFQSSGSCPGARFSARSACP